MTRLGKHTAKYTAISLLPLALLVHEGRANACGGCFHGPPPVSPTEVESVITDHRMAFSISPTQTVLWDQVRYTGNPIEFAWVLPIRPGARVELASNQWLAALDASTETTISGPVPRQCSNGSFAGGGGGGGGGCGFGGSSSADSFSANSGSAEELDAGFNGSPAVQVVDEEVVGPYDAVTLHSTDAGALETWLVSNGFLIPDAIRPIVNQYVSEKFDFIALKLRPGETVRAMQPVRVITPGADPTLPLRMVAAGIGAYVGLTLFVVSEGSYHPANFPDATIDFNTLTWSGLQSRSNYTALADAAMKAGDGRGWLTEAASPPALFSTYAGSLGSSAPNPGLYDAYYGSCRAQAQVMVPCDPSTLPGGDAGPVVDSGGLDDGGDASSDAGDGGMLGTPDAGPACYRYVSACDALDDLDVALTGMHQSDVWVTRLRAFLPASALNGDLRLEAAAQSIVPSAHHTDTYTEAGYDPCGDAGAAIQSNGSSDGGGCACTTRRESGRSGTLFILGASALAAAGLMRRRSRR